MTMTRAELYKALDGYRPRLPRYVNFASPLRDDSPFGFRLRVQSGDAGLGVEREAFIAGQPVPEEELERAVDAARDQYAALASAALPDPMPPFSGVDFQCVVNDTPLITEMPLPQVERVSG